MRWHRLEALGDVPGARSSHAVAAVGQNVYLFGGELQARVPVAQDLFRYDLTSKQWTRIKPEGMVPGPRVAATMAAINDKLYLFGGRTGVEMGEGATADLLVLDTRTMTWSAVAQSGQQPELGVTQPAPRSYHAMTAAGGKLFVFGGCGAAGRLSDLWCFTPGDAPATGVWAQLPGCPGLGPRGGAVLAAAPDGSRLWVLGGFNGAELADCHEYNVNDRTWRCCNSGSETAGPGAQGAGAGQAGALAMPLGRSVFGAAAHGGCHSHAAAATADPCSTACNTACSTACSHCCHIVTFGGEVSPSDKGHAGAGSFCAATLCLAPPSSSSSSSAAAAADAVASAGWHQLEAAGGGPGPRGWFAATAVGGGNLLVHGGLGPGNERLGDMHLLEMH